MIYKRLSSQTDHARIIFELPDSLWADRVFVTGDFNQWSPTQTPLIQERDGAWRATLDLPAGKRYQFHYLINIEALLKRSDLRIEFRLQPGQMLFTNNHWILHNRTAFVDYAELERRRHYIRLWLQRHSAHSSVGLS